MADVLNTFITFLNDILWGYVLIAMLICVGGYFTLKLNFAQFKFIGHMIKLLSEGVSSADGEKGVSSFQAFCISTASRVGTGNLAGVAIAIATGGPGAVFWMWLIALIGGASSFVESTLAQIYKVKNKDEYIGGPAYYMERALNKKWMGLIFSILITVTFGLVFNSVQANTIALAFEGAFSVSKFIVGAVLSALTAFIIFGGVHRVAKISSIIVPVMATAYVIVALFIVFKNIAMVPEIFSQIIGHAFGLRPALGGSIGAAMMLGIKRGLFSNEAGMGSAPNAAAAAETTHPAKQGFIQTLGVFTDTILICSCTAFMVLLSGAHLQPGLSGIQLTQVAISSQVGAWGHLFIAVCIFLFAYSSIIGNYYYGEANIDFLSTNKSWLTAYRVLVIGMVMFGSVSEMGLVWNLADLTMGLMAILNLVAIVMLGKVAVDCLKHYISEKKQRKNPVFYKDSIDLPNVETVECWDRNR